MPSVRLLGTASSEQCWAGACASPKSRWGPVPGHHVGGISDVAQHGQRGGPPSPRRSAPGVSAANYCSLEGPRSPRVVRRPLLRMEGMTDDGGHQPHTEEERAAATEAVEDLTRAAYYKGELSLLEPLRGALLELAEPVGAREHRAVAGGLLVTYKLSQLVQDLERALFALERVYATWPSDAATNNLASCLLEAVSRVEMFGDQQDRIAAFWRAIAMLRTVVPADVTHPSWMARATTLSSGLVDGFQMGIGGVAIDDVVAQAKYLIEGMTVREADDAEALNVAASALLAAADVGHPEGDLDLALEWLDRSLASTPGDHLDRPARLANLASVHIDRFERGIGDRAELERALALAREAVATLDDADPQQIKAINVLTNGLTAAWQYLGREDSLQEALGYLPLFVEHVAQAGPWAAGFVENAALLAFNGARTLPGEEGDPLLALSASLFQQLIAGTQHTDSAWAARQGAFAAVLAQRYQRTRNPQDLEAAIGAARYGVAGARAVPHEWAVYAMTLGNLLHDQFLLMGRVALLDESSALHRQALDALAGSAPGKAAFLNNLSIVAHEKFQRFGRIEDLRMAVESIEIALAACPEDLRGQAARCANAASTLLDLYRARGGVRNLERARSLARRGAEISDELGDKGTSQVCLGTLSDILQMLAFAPETCSGIAEPARVELRRLWTYRSWDLLSGTGGVLAQRLVRLARLPRAIVGEMDRISLLDRAAREALQTRPAVSLAAAREALELVLAARRSGAHANGADAEWLVDTAFDALDALVENNADWASSLTWLRDARGTGALAAQLRLLDADPSGAVDAFERGHALLLGRIAGKPGAAAIERSISPQEPRSPDASEMTLYVWAAPGGGGAVLARRGAIQAFSLLPHLTSDTAAAMREILSSAPHEGVTAVDQAVEQVADTLGEALAPFEQWLRSDNAPPRLTICAGGVLGSMPWAAAKLPGGALLDDLVVLYASPTMAVVRHCQSILQQWSAGDVTRGRDVVSLAAPAPSRLRPLPQARDEGFALAGVGGLLSGPRATRLAAEYAQESARVLHLACHGTTTQNDPLANRIFLAHDEPWYAEEILRAASSPRLVVLSTCESATVEGVHADEGLGLASAFLAAGTPGVVASLWSVGDRAAGQFISQAAPGLRASRRDPALVLRHTRAAQRDAGIPASGWAAFTFLGR